MSQTTSAAETPAQRARHVLARAEDRYHRLRARWLKRRGFVPTIIGYTGYGSPGWLRVLARVVLARPDSPPDQWKERVRGWRLFFSTPAGAEGGVVVTVDGAETEVEILRGGIVDARVEAYLPPGWHTVWLRTPSSQPVRAEVFVVDPAERFGTLSDLDDTVMVTALPRPLLAAWNTFVVDEHARRPVSGMAVLYDRIRRQHSGAPFIYLSTGAWNVAPTLRRFLGRNLYPPGPLLLTDWGPANDRFFRNGPQHKRSQLDRLAEEFPDVRWLLIGDDGQHDEELYAEFARAHPRNVAAVCIRQLSVSEAVLAGGRKRAAERELDSPVRWFFAPDGAALHEQLVTAGVIAAR